MPNPKSESYKAAQIEQGKRERARKALLTPEQLKQEKDERKSRQEWFKIQRDERRVEIPARKLMNREVKILKFMKTSNVEYHHHSSVDNINIDPYIALAKSQQSHTSYDSYYWNHSGGTSQMPIALLGRLFSSSEFDTIYDVPLDGTYRFQCYDSGQRGMGAFDRITAIKVEAPAYVPFVNPGAMIPITAN